MLGRKILIADAEDHVLCVLGYKLREAGFRISVARDGATADAILRAERHDLLITELSVPGKGDLELCAQHPDISSLVLTSRANDVPESDLRPANVRHVLLKPFSPRQLVARVKEILTPEAA
jgi:DNA-binding response OmpR family regulator